jgi:CheY-like chemotaxis protein
VLSREELAPDEVIERLVPMLRRLVGEDIALELALDPAAGPVRADRGQLEQVIVNLAVNARDAMPGGGRLTLATSGFDADPEFARLRLGIEPGPLVVIAVSDTGHGMDAETQEHIFEPFFTTKAPSAGTGLGLATAYGIVSQSEGSISVYSEPGHGTTFRIHLPRVAQAQGGIPDQLEAAPREAPTGGTETIHVAEADEAIRGLIRLVLEDDGYQVLSAATPAEALAIAADRDQEIDLIVSDMVMPGLSGPELAARIREQHGTIAVLFTSGYSSDEIVRRGLERDVPFIEKPFTPDALLHKVREVLSLSRRADAPSARSSRRS